MLVEAEELNSCRNQEAVRIIVSQLEPVGAQKITNSDPVFIPDSHIFDVEEYSQKGVESPHTLLSEADFNRKASRLGITIDSKIAVYDNVGVYSSPRVWFNLKYMGCNNVALLNGGLNRWQQSGYEVVSEARSSGSLGDFQGQSNFDMVASKETVLEKISSDRCQIIDVRSANRFLGIDPEPRPGVRRGHIPNSVNIPFSTFLDSSISGQRYKKRDELQKIFDDMGSFKKEELIFLCGSGVTACIGYFAAHLCGIENLKLYDGSWAEWGSIESLPIEI